MSSATPVTQSALPFSVTTRRDRHRSLPLTTLKFTSLPLRGPQWAGGSRGRAAAMVVSATTAEIPKKKRQDKAFVDEMRVVAMKLHTRDQAREGEKDSTAPPVAKWEPSVEGYLRFLVDSKLVYETLDRIIQTAPHPWYAEFRNTGLERTEKLVKDLEWFKEQGHTIPEPSSPGISYALYLDELSKKDPQAFICHFYNIYFAHSAGGRMIGKKDLRMGMTVGADFRQGTLYLDYLHAPSTIPAIYATVSSMSNAELWHRRLSHPSSKRLQLLTESGALGNIPVAEMVLDKKELEFYKWDGELSQLLQNVRDKINQVASSWSRKEKDHCLEETEKSFKYSGEILRLILS